jgi:hypothetical protein
MNERLDVYNLTALIYEELTKRLGDAGGDGYTFHRPRQFKKKEGEA